MKPKLLILMFLLAVSQTLYGQAANDWANKAGKKINNRDYEGAIVDCNRAIALNPKLPSAYNNRGLAKADLGRYADAITDYSQAIALDPEDAIAYHNRGLAKYSIKKYADAISDDSLAITIDPKYRAAYSQRGLSKYELGRYAEAIADYDQAIAIDPNSFIAYNNRGLAKIKLERFSESIPDFDRGISLSSQYPVPSLYNNRGYAYYKLGSNKTNYQKAIEDYDKAGQLGGTKYDPLFKFRDDAVAAIKKTINSSDAQESQDWVDKGGEKLNNNDFDGAISDCTKAISIDPMLKNAYDWRGVANLYAGNFDNAITDFDHSIILDPKAAPIYVLRSSAKIKLGRYVDAIADCNSAIEFGNNFYTAYNARGYCYYKMGKTKENYRKAIGDYDMAIKLGGSSYKPSYKYRAEAVTAMAKVTGR